MASSLQRHVEPRRRSKGARSLIRRIPGSELCGLAQHRRAGVFTFLDEHIDVDPAQVHMTDKYVTELVTSEAELHHVLRGMHST